jgi:hypothetical protein
MSRFAKVLTTLFTSLCAPIMVSVVVQELNVAHGSAGAIPNGSPALVAAEPRDIVVSHGLGADPAQAHGQALRAALTSVIGSLPGTKFTPVESQAACESILHDPRGVILRCEDLACSRQLDKGRQMYCQEISVEVARAALLRRLEAAR